ncbi:hypothetical protein EDF56_101145 [Novosphingobium sp. PhB165]|uniref:hypothetical protein n=1 Tax=Novosphingobium sp. PhB165 TaxID=2485105 RepID=UPI001044CB1D|nr:hypothetical protein [Novosphingobium sp. PhB165]TCM21481.1 hypothetical protein EDF56_101145 [Novosphingobium sp. PhB165]
MTKLSITNLTNSPFDLEGGHRLPAMGSVTEHFSDDYAAALRLSPGVQVSEPAEDAELDALRAQAEELGIEVDGRWGAKRLETEIAKARKA